MKIWIVFGLLIAGVSFASAQAQTNQRLDEMTKLRLSQLRSGGVALLPIQLTLTMPPSLKSAPINWQGHMEDSMTDALEKVRYDIQVVPPETTMIILNEIYLTEGLTSALVQGDSLMLPSKTFSLLRERTGSRFIMGMSLASEWMPQALRKAYTDTDPIMVTCRIWDTQTGQIIWQTQHPYSVPAEASESQQHSRMRELCAKILAKIPQ